MLLYLPGVGETRMDEKGYIVTEWVVVEVEDDQQVNDTAAASSALNLNPKPKPSENKPKPSEHKDTEKTKPASKPAVLY
jgi:hypothetical protein